MSQAGAWSPHTGSRKESAINATPKSAAATTVAINPAKDVFCISIRYSERLADGNTESSVGSVGDSHDNALAETTNGLNKAEVIHRQSWKRAKRWNWPH